ncbi:MAG: ribosome-associated translation inhibitor RaiA [Deltaproteobacteria bacterium]|nr:ribosome-associated translation inhibitor RaiA [Deltaproteobacteria bacterium]
MPVTVTFRRVRPTDALRRYAETKSQRLQKFVHAPVDAHVILSVDKHRHIAELVVNADRLNLTATEETADLYSAIDLALDKIERQLARRTTKRKDRKFNSGATVERAATVGRATRDRRARVIATERVAVKPMSVDEGVLQMNLLKKDFLLFKNEATNALSVVYRRRDGNYGLIEPEVP